MFGVTEFTDLNLEILYGSKIIYSACESSLTIREGTSEYNDAFAHHQHKVSQPHSPDIVYNPDSIGAFALREVNWGNLIRKGSGIDNGETKYGEVLQGGNIVFCGIMIKNGDGIDLTKLTVKNAGMEC